MRNYHLALIPGDGIGREICPFGDILTDLGGTICGSLGLAASGNLNPARGYPSMVEPVHGSVPDTAGRGIAYPIAMIWSGGMMLDFLGETEAAELMMTAIKRVTGEGRVLPREVGDSAATVEVGNEIVARMGDAEGPV